MDDLEDHTLIIRRHLEDHKRGVFQPACRCGWKGKAVYSSTTFDQENKLRFAGEWRGHLPAGYQSALGVCEDADGTVHTGQAVVSSGDDVFYAFSTKLTPVALHASGNWYGDIGDLDDAESIIIPASNVTYVTSTPWWDMHYVDEEDMDMPEGFEDPDDTGTA